MIVSSGQPHANLLLFMEAERWRSPAAGSGSDAGADAGGSQVQRQTVSKPHFWSMQALSAIDFVRPHFRKIDFLHSLALGSAVCPA
jgi:hypothetical protein